MTTAYVYKWTHLPSLSWYVGSRVAKNCHLGDGYICSSKTVLPMILKNPTEWKREVIATGTPLDMYELETEILKLAEARKDSRSLNGHNNDGNYFPANYGVNNPMYGKKHSQNARLKMSIASKGKKRSELARKNISEAHKGISNGPHSEETKTKMSLSMKGRPSLKKGVKIISDKRYYHNGLISKKFVPGTEPKEFIPGRIIAKRKLVATESNVQLTKGEN